MKKSILSYPPRWATLAIIGNCTNRCKFCSYHSLDARNGKSNVYNIKYTMSVQRFRKNIEFFYNANVPHIHICASGEPFLHPDIMDIIDTNIDVYGDFSLQSNFNKTLFRKHDYIKQLIDRKKYISYIVTDVISGDALAFSGVKKGSNIDDHISILRILSEHNIPIITSFIVSKTTYRNLLGIVELMAKNSIRLQINLVNLFPHMFNEMTQLNNVYKAEDIAITEYLYKAKQVAQKFGITLSDILPFDDPRNVCSVFWDKVQMWPVMGCDMNRACENLVPHACNAVVLGSMNSLGYLDDYPTVMDFWNNPKLVAIRESILAGKAPDRYCNTCPSGTMLSTEHCV